MDRDELPPPPRTWKHKFYCAFKGLKLGMRGHSSFCIHFFAGTLVILLAAALGCSQLEWSVLLICITLVIGFELANSAIETMVRAFPAEERFRFSPALDVAAGTVLFVSIAVSVIGAAILLPRIFVLIS